MKHVANFLIFSGLIFLLVSGGLYFQSHNPNRLSFNLTITENQKSLSPEENAPSYLFIDRLGIALPIFPAEKSGKVWPTTSKGVSYLVGSGEIDKPGNLVMYGHNWQSILGNLPNSKVGDQIEIITKDGMATTYEVAEIKIVSPDDTTVIQTSDSDSILTLYTCTGFLDSKRFVVIANQIRRS